MKARILIVDDEELIRESLQEILRLEGYETSEAANGEIALSLLQEQSYDLVLLDLKMPGVDGVEILRQVSRAYPEIKIILLTGHGSLESAIEALRNGAHDYILKPAPHGEILTSIARALARKAEQQQKRMLIEQLDSSLQRLKDVEGFDLDQLGGTETIVLDNGVNVDLVRREIWRGDERVSLTPTEGKLMRVLLENRGRVLTHQDLVLLVQGYETTDWEAPEVLRPLVSRLRRKLSVFPNGERWIANVRGTGYVLEWNPVTEIK